MSCQFTELVDVEGLQELMSRLYAAAGIPVGIIGTDGTIYVATGWQDICTRFHRQHPITAARCHESDEYISRHLDEAPYAQYRCRNGLWDIAVPIRLCGEHLATLFVGQFHFDDDPPDRGFFISLAKECGFDTEEYLRALDRLPVFTHAKIRAIVDYYLLFVNRLVDEGINRRDRRAAEEELRITTQRLLLATSSGHLGVWDWDVQGNVMVWNDRMFELYGISRDTFTGSIEAWVNGLHPDDKERAFAECQSALEGGKPFDTSFRVVHPDGTISFLKADGKVIRASDGTAVRMIGINRDMTEQKRVEEALHENEQRLRIIIETSQAGIILVDPRGVITFANKRMAEMFGCSMDELVGSLYFDHLHPAEKQAGDIRMRQMIAGEVDHVYTERHYLRKDGRDFWGYLSGRRLETPDGELQSLVGTIADITDIRESREALRRSEERYRSIIELAVDTIMHIDGAGRVINVNESGSVLTGYPLEALTGMNITRLFSEAELKRIPFRYDLLMEGKTVRTERLLVRRDGTTVPVDMNSKMMPDGTFQTFMRDMTEHRMMEAEFIKRQKLESLGVLAGGIAHDFNNILTGIMGNISFAKEVIDPTHEAFSPLEKAEKASLRAAGLARQLLVFAKGGQPVKKRVSLPQVVNEAVSLALSGTNVTCVFDLPQPLHIVEADEGQLNQAFHNIVINAVQAMPGGGTLTVRGENVTVDNDTAGDLQAGEYVKLTFADEGCGISEAEQKKVFDPYFSTKPGGTGLGLASTYAIVNQHGGQISVSSTLGTGTVFTVFLPSTGRTDPGQNPGNGTAPVEHDGDSILVMDDEEMIRELACLTLGRVGYRVTTCGNGDEAISLYKTARAAGTPFSMVIMDLTIPGGMGGVETARRLLTVDPAARLIVSSGYSDDPVMANYREYGFCAAIEKPYNVKDISMLLAEARKDGQ
jgi:PAS domain S-box-containing protein